MVITIVTLIPLTHRGGKEISEIEMAGIFERFYLLCGGYTIEGRTEGAWRNEQGKKELDECLKLSLVIDEAHRDDLRRLVLEIGKELGQAAMLWQELPGSEILLID